MGELNRWVGRRPGLTLAAASLNIPREPWSITVSSSPVRVDVLGRKSQQTLHGDSRDRAAFAGSILSDVQHKLVERNDHQHDQPKNVTWNIGIKRLDKARVLMRLQFLFWRRLQHGRLPLGLQL